MIRATHDRRQRVQAITLAVLLVAAALEAWAIAGGLTALRDGLLMVIAATMAVAAIWG
jgi:hypothetical protein